MIPKVQLFCFGLKQIHELVVLVLCGIKSQNQIVTLCRRDKINPKWMYLLKKFNENTYFSSKIAKENNHNYEILYTYFYVYR